VYGSGYTTWLQAYGADVIVLEVPYNQSIDPAAVQTMLAQNPGVELVTMVHVDTPNGTKNPIEQICPIAKAAGAVTLVDAASTFGGMPLFPDAMGIDIAVGATQKCLAGPVGVGIMSVSADAWALIAQNPNAPTNSYLSMTDWKTDWLEGGFFPSGPSITSMYGIEAALTRLLALGVQNSFDLHQRASTAFRAGALATGLKLWAASDAIASDTGTTLAVPENLTQKQVVAAVRQFGAAVNGSTLTDPLGAAGASGGTVRVGHMGIQTAPDFVVALLVAVGRGYGSLGVSVDIDAGVEAARAALTQ
jgi:pyridoxamine--pyruvate transaminase